MLWRPFNPIILEAQAGRDLLPDCVQVRSAGGRDALVRWRSISFHSGFGHLGEDRPQGANVGRNGAGGSAHEVPGAVTTDGDHEMDDWLREQQGDVSEREGLATRVRMHTHIRLPGRCFAEQGGNVHFVGIAADDSVELIPCLGVNEGSELQALASRVLAQGVSDRPHAPGGSRRETLPPQGALDQPAATLGAVVHR